MITLHKKKIQNSKNTDDIRNNVDREQDENEYVPGIDMEKAFPNGCDKYYLKLSPSQLMEVKKVFGVATWCYNQAVQMVFREKKIRPTVTSVYDFDGKFYHLIR
jgi:hypothetical protein